MFLFYKKFLIFHNAIITKYTYYAANFEDVTLIIVTISSEKEIIT